MIFCSTSLSLSLSSSFRQSVVVSLLGIACNCENDILLSLAVRISNRACGFSLNLVKCPPLLLSVSCCRIIVILSPLYYHISQSLLLCFQEQVFLLSFFLLYLDRIPLWYSVIFFLDFDLIHIHFLFFKNQLTTASIPPKIKSSDERLEIPI